MAVSTNIKNKYNKAKEAYIAFDYNNKTYRLPVNPETFEVSSVMSTETYDILGLGQIVIPTGMEVREFNFETELPYQAYPYVEASKKFWNVDRYETFFNSVRKKKVPVGFVYDNGVSEEISTKVLIVEFNSTENAGEEGDKQYSFKLLEYVDYGPKIVSKSKSNSSSSKRKKTTITTKKTTTKTNTKKPKMYVVQEGDCLWNLAKKFYGSGTKYTKIYNANRSIIKNPSLIYPGMKLKIPD